MQLSSRLSKATSTEASSSPYEPKWLPGRYSSSYLIAIKRGASSGPTSLQFPDATADKRALDRPGHCVLFSKNCESVVPYITPHTSTFSASVGGVAVPASFMITPKKDHYIDAKSGALLVAMDCVEIGDQSAASQFGPGWVIMEASTFGRFPLDQSRGDGSMGDGVVTRSGDREAETVQSNPMTAAFQRAIASFRGHSSQ